MSVLWILNVVVEFAGCIIFLALGVSGCLYAYGFAGQSLFSRFRWRPEFRSALRWLAPLVVVLLLAGLVLQVRELLISQRAPNHPAAGKAGLAPLLAIERHRPGLPEPGR